MLALLVAFVLLLSAVIMSFIAGGLRANSANVDKKIDGRVGYVLATMLGSLALACARYL